MFLEFSKENPIVVINNFSNLLEISSRNSLLFFLNENFKWEGIALMCWKNHSYWLRFILARTAKNTILVRNLEQESPSTTLEKNIESFSVISIFDHLWAFYLIPNNIKIYYLLFVSFLFPQLYILFSPDFSTCHLSIISLSLSLSLEHLSSDNSLIPHSLIFFFTLSSLTFLL